MDQIQFIDLTATTALILFLVGFVGGMVSGFIGSGGAFVLTPAMMSLGVPGVVAVASNMAHKFPKALVGAYKRNKYGQVDIKLGVVMGIFAEAGVLFGKHVMVGIREAFGMAGTNLYVSFVFVVVLGIVGAFVLRDGLREKRGENVYVHLKMGETLLQGITVMAVEEGESVTFVNIVGEIDPEQIGRLGRKFDIHELDELGDEWHNRHDRKEKNK